MDDKKRIDEEIDAMVAIAKALDGKDEETRCRIIRWAASAFTGTKNNTAT